MKLRLDFFFTGLSQHFRIYLFNGLCTQVCYLWAWVRGDIKSFVLLKVVQPQPKYKTRFKSKFRDHQQKTFFTLSGF